MEHLQRRRGILSCEWQGRGIQRMIRQQIKKKKVKEIFLHNTRGGCETYFCDVLRGPE